MTPAALEGEIRRLLDEIKDPCSVAASIAMGLNEMGIVKSIDVSGAGHVDIQLRLTSPFCEMIAYMSKEAIAKVSGLAGVTGVTVGHDSGLDWEHDMIAPEAQARRRHRLDLLRNLVTASSEEPARA